MERGHRDRGVGAESERVRHGVDLGEKEDNIFGGKGRGSGWQEHMERGFWG